MDTTHRPDRQPLTVTTWPQAEAAARALRLPLAVDPVARELYGVADPVLDEAAARLGVIRALRARDCDRPIADAELDAAMLILRERAAAAVAL